MNGTPWSLGVRCDQPGCAVVFESDFWVPENSTRDGRLRVVLEYVGNIGWGVEYPPGISRPDEAATFCPAHVKIAGDTPCNRGDVDHAAGRP